MLSVVRRYYFSYPLPCFPSLQSYCCLPSVLNISTRKREKFCQQTPHLRRGGGCPSYWNPTISPVPVAQCSPPLLKAKQWKCVMIRKDNLWYFLKAGNSGNFTSYNFKLFFNSKDSFILPLLISLFIWYDIILSLTLIKDCETLCC